MYKGDVVLNTDNSLWYDIVERNVCEMLQQQKTGSAWSYFKFAMGQEQMLQSLQAAPVEIQIKHQPRRVWWSGPMTTSLVKHDKQDTDLINHELT